MNPAGDDRRPRLFGGQVAAQAARAASLTVPDDRSIHSLHGYFLRAGRADRPTILHVDRDRDGRSFSARHVTARQDGEVIMSLLVSFHVDEVGPEYQAVGLPPDVPQPEDVAPPAGWFPHQSVLDLRITGTGRPRGKWGGPPHQFWTRARGPLPDDRLLHACVLTYLSDVGTGLEKLMLDEPWWGPEPRPRGLVPPPGSHGRLGAGRPRPRRRRRRGVASTPGRCTTATAGSSPPSRRSTSCAKASSARASRPRAPVLAPLDGDMTPFRGAKTS